MEPRKFFKRKALGFIIVVVLVGLFYLFNNYIYQQKQGDPENATSPQNATYVVDGNVIRLEDGLSEIEQENSSSKITTRYFGNELLKDLDDDGREDSIFYITQETGGSGTFYYVVAALNTEDGYIGSQAFFIGDRIAPQSIDSGDYKQVVVNYADRAEDEPLTTDPSIGKSFWIILDIESMSFGEVVKDFEGEADPNRMSLGMKEWVWVETTYNDGTVIKPSTAGDFTLRFEDDDAFVASTDCNGLMGQYVEDDGSYIAFSDIIYTAMYCEGSTESEYSKMLQNTTSYFFTSKGELVLGLKFDSGSSVFK